MFSIRVFSKLSILAVVNASRSQQVGPSRAITDTLESIRERYRRENNRKAFSSLLTKVSKHRCTYVSKYCLILIIIFNKISLYGTWASQLYFYINKLFWHTLKVIATNKALALIGNKLYRVALSVFISRWPQFSIFQNTYLKDCRQTRLMRKALSPELPSLFCWKTEKCMIHISETREFFWNK